MFIVYSTNTTETVSGYDTNITFIGIAENDDIAQDLVKKEKQFLLTTYSHYLNDKNIDKEYSFEIEEIDFTLNKHCSFIL